MDVGYIRRMYLEEHFRGSLHVQGCRGGLLFRIVDRFPVSAIASSTETEPAVNLLMLKIKVESGSLNATTMRPTNSGHAIAPKVKAARCAALSRLRNRKRGEKEALPSPIWIADLNGSRVVGLDVVFEDSHPEPGELGRVQSIDRDDEPENCHGGYSSAARHKPDGCRCRFAA
jgi:hypothetical protein